VGAKEYWDAYQERHEVLRDRLEPRGFRDSPCNICTYNNESRTTTSSMHQDESLYGSNRHCY
jgi:hypothetical protein